MAARTNGTFPTPADGLQCVVDTERKVAGMEATAARVAASKGTKRVHWIEEAQSHDEPRALKTRSRKPTGDTTEDLSPESMDAPRKPRKREAGGLGNDAKDRTSGLGVTARGSTHEGAQEVTAGYAASGTVIEPSRPFTATGERIPEEMQPLSLDQRTFKGRVSRLSEEQIAALVDEALACLED